jgi:anti-anti-sigma factor
MSKRHPAENGPPSRMAEIVPPGLVEVRMLTIQTEKIGDVAVVVCQGRIVQSDAAFKLRDEVIKQEAARAIVLDFSEVASLGGGGLGMIAFLQAWAHDHDIDFKLFEPSDSVKQLLQSSGSVVKPEIVGIGEVLSLLGWIGKDGGVSLAA